MDRIRTGVTIATLLWAAGSQAAPVNEPGSAFAWAADGTKIAYCGKLFSSEPQLWTIDVASGARKPLVAADRLGRASCSPIWHPSGRQILIGRPHEILLVDATTGQTRVLVSSQREIGSMRTSPDGNWISYVAGGQLLVRPFVKGDTRVLAWSDEGSIRAEPDWLYANRIGMETAYWWAPDSSAIAYLQIARLQKAFPTASDPLPAVAVRIVDVGSTRKLTRTVALPASEAYLGQIVWAPDSSGLAIQRLDRRQTRLEVLLADAKTGATERILAETDPYWINLDPNGFQFLPDGKRFLWTSERSGFRHIYLYELQGGRLVSAVTSGEWEVSGIEAADEHSVTYTATRQSAVERQLYVSSLDRPADAVRLTREHGWNHVVAAHDHVFVEISSSLSRLPSMRVVDRNGVVREIPTPSPEDELLPVEMSTVRTHDGLDLNALLIRPPHFDQSKQYPTVVLAPTGPRSQIARDASDSDEFLWAQDMALRGFVVFAVDGRGSGGRGRRFEEPLHYRLGGMELPDQLDALAFLKGLGFVDMRRIGIFGSGYAGMLALGAMMHSHGIYAAGFADSPITDWTQADAWTAERYLGPKTGAGVPYLESSPNEFAKRLKGPMLVTAEPGRPGALDHLAALRHELEETHMLRPGRASIELMERPAMFERAMRFFIDTLVYHPECACN